MEKWVDRRRDESWISDIYTWLYFPKTKMIILVRGRIREIN